MSLVICQDEVLVKVGHLRDAPPFLLSLNCLKFRLDCCIVHMKNVWLLSKRLLVDIYQVGKTMRII